MSSKIIEFDVEARSKLKKGVDQLDRKSVV